MILSVFNITYTINIIMFIKKYVTNINISIKISFLVFTIFLI